MIAVGMERTEEIYKSMVITVEEVKRLPGLSPQLLGGLWYKLREIPKFRWRGAIFSNKESGFQNMCFMSYKMKQQQHIQFLEPLPHIPTSVL